jgi:V8-like Glu-specific endopeptidase
MGKLSGEDIKKLSTMLSGTLSFNDLESFVYASTGDRLFVEFVAPGKPMRPTISDLLIALEDIGSTAKFLSYVYANRPGRPDVRSEIAKAFPEAVAVPEQKIELSAQTAGAPQANAPTNAHAPGLQRNVRPYLAKLDIRVWQSRMTEIERRVCRVELDGNALGTGFLVGPDTVLTNWHVFEAAKKQGQADKLGCRFDYELLPDGKVQPGQLVMLQAAGLIDSSPYSVAEGTSTPDNPLPTTAELDYALLRLASRVGEQQVEGAARGWIALPKAGLPLAADAPILIVQHPQGTPMKLAMDTQAVIGLNGNGTRINYRTNTDPGSSGSPVFTMDWDLVALHHSGDPAWVNPTYNQGVPIELVRQRIEAGGFGNTLGA